MTNYEPGKLDEVHQIAQYYVDQITMGEVAKTKDFWDGVLGAMEKKFQFEGAKTLTISFKAVLARVKALCGISNDKVPLFSKVYRFEVR